jgi:titin
VGVTANDQGVYVCRATNALGQAETNAQVEVITRNNVVTETEHEAAMSQISYLETVKTGRASEEEQAVRQPPNFTKPLKDMEVSEGKNVHLEARLMPTGDSTMKVEWTVDGRPLKTGL